MDQSTRNSLLNATQQARSLLEQEIAEQLEGTFDILPDGTIADKPGPHLDEMQRLVRTKIVDSIRHRAGGSKKVEKVVEAIADYVREVSFTILNRHIALKMLEVRGLVQQCVSKGDQSSGFKEFCLPAPGLLQLPDKGYRLYLECLFDELSTEVKILFDRHNDVSLLWPRRQALEELLDVLNAQNLAGVWAEDETIGWVYQYFNSDDDRKKARYDAKGKPKAPQNSYELAVRNQFFTPRYVVEFLTDNTLGRTWYEMRQGNTTLADKCRYLVRRPDEVFLGAMSDADHEVAAEDTVAFARLLDEDSTDEFPEFEPGDTQRLIEFAHCVNAYERHPLGDHVDGEWWPWSMMPKFEAARDLHEFKTQDILDVMFCQCRADHHGGTEGISDPIFLRLANEVRRRVLESREPDRTQQQLLQQPVFVRHRAKKDPRDLKILDPACGSSHFLIYCFDLLLTIYEEAWNDPESPAAVQVPGPDGKSPAKQLREDYATIEALRAAVPGLILRHNLHGIDIDPRCVQIGAFALWMRAQRSYNEFRLPKEERPRISKANIVVAEPMPAEADLLAEVKSTIQPAVLGQLLEVVVEKMRLAGEAGSLLRIDEELQTAIAKARAEWTRRPKTEQALLFGQTEPKPKQTTFDFAGITDAKFWEEAEAKTLAALSAFGHSAANGDRFRRSLFADDAAAGFAFIDVCRLRMDVVLMNPPFGAASVGGKKYIEGAYPRTKNDLYAAFVERGIQWLHPRAKLGAITSRTGFFLSSFQKWREEVLLKEAPPTVFADLGHGVMDAAMVEAAAYCLEVRR